MSSFTSPLVDRKLVGEFNAAGNQLYEVCEAFTYDIGLKGAPTQITVPVGFKTDFASTPKWTHFLLPPDGPWKKAAVIHDYMYHMGYDRFTADVVFLEAMIASGVAVAVAWIFFLAVRCFGWLFYQSKKDERNGY